MEEFEELWVEVPFFTDYSVSNYGTVINHKTNEEVRQFVTWNGGEVKVRLYVDAAYADVYVAHLVAEAFFLNYHFGCEVGHLNGYLEDNSVLNLTLVVD